MSFPVTIEGGQADIVKESATALHPVGTRMVLEDGRVFRYALNGGTALSKGKLCSNALAEGDEYEDLTSQDAATTADDNITLLVAYSTASVTCAADRFKEGYMYVNTGTGAGQVVQIAKNDAGGSSTGATVKIYFKEDEYLSAALDTSSSKIGLVKNLYDSVVVHSKCTNYAPGYVPVGIPPIEVTANYYFWLQTWGPAAVLEGANLSLGKKARIGSSTGADGEVRHFGVLTSGNGTGAAVELPSIGIVIAGSTDTEYALVFLTLAP